MENREVKTTMSDSHAWVVLVHTRFEALQPEANKCHVYVLVAPHIANQGMKDEGRNRFSIAIREAPENTAELENPDARETDRNEKKEFQPHLG
jgi:hypothetical protein